MLRFQVCPKCQGPARPWVLRWGDGETRWLHPSRHRSTFGKMILGESIGIHGAFRLEFYMFFVVDLFGDV